MKMSEVDFLRAEGHLYGWDMGGSESFFYNRGLDNAYLEDRDMKMASTYVTRLEEYKNLEAPVAYTYVDPQGIVNNEPSVTQIGVKWNEGDSPEVKLEKIITQKYIAAYPYSYEPWVDMRRTGYPKVFPVINPGNGDGCLKYTPKTAVAVWVKAIRIWFIPKTITEPMDCMTMEGMPTL